MPDQTHHNEAAQHLAEAASRSMHQQDRCAHKLGIKPIGVGPGWATMEMVVTEDMVNGHDFCHGGIIFTLADTAFAHACNSYNNITVSSSCTIDYIHPAKRGDILIADARESSLSGRTGVYDIIVSSREVEKIAFFRGRSYCVRGHLVDEVTNDE